MNNNVQQDHKTMPRQRFLTLWRLAAFGDFRKKNA